jgi:hypothetical protein
VGLLEETKGGGKEGKNDGERIIMKYFTSVIEKTQGNTLKMCNNTG